MSFSEEQRDCLQEIVNVAIGKAGDSLARYLGVFVNLSVPKIMLSDAESAGDTLYHTVGDEEQVIAVKQEFTGQDSEFQGDGIVLFTKPTLGELVSLVGEKAVGSQCDAETLLLDTTKIINSDCLSGLGDQLEVAFTYALPSIMGMSVETRSLVRSSKNTCTEALLIEINYTLEQGEFRCNWLLLMPGKAIAALKQSINRLLIDD